MTQANKKYAEQPSAKLASTEASASEPKKSREKIHAIGKESAEHFAKSADDAANMLSDAIAASRDNIEACIECGSRTATFATEISSEAFDYANKTLSDAMENSKELFACRTINDMLTLQNKVIASTIESFFNQSNKLSEIAFNYAEEALEPISERVAKAAQ